LGLYISRQLAEAHGGRLAVAPGPVCGSVFSLTLPLSANA
jgi:signal transduction histidine kinase